MAFGAFFLYMIRASVKETKKKFHVCEILIVQNMMTWK